MTGPTSAYQPTSISARLSAAPRYSYRDDAAVPRFDDAHALIVYDGVCVFCSHAMTAIARGDPRRHFQFASAQSPLGHALFRHYGLDPETFKTVLLLADGRAFGKLEAVREIARVVGGAWRLTKLMRLLPRWAQDRAYDLVADNRYRIFGRASSCQQPGATWRVRIIDYPAE